MYFCPGKSASDSLSLSHTHIRTLGTGTDEQTETVLRSGNCLQHLRKLLSDLHVDPSQSTQKEACWTLSNITAGSQAQIQAVIDSGCIGDLVLILEAGKFDARKEAAWALSNATSGGTPQQVQFLIQEGVVGPLCALFDCADPKIVMVALEGIENMVRLDNTPFQDGEAWDKDSLASPDTPLGDAKGEAGQNDAESQLVEQVSVLKVSEGDSENQQTEPESTQSTEPTPAAEAKPSQPTPGTKKRIPFAQQIAELGAVSALVTLMQHPFPEISQKALTMLMEYWSDPDGLPPL